MVSAWVDTLKRETGSPLVCERKALTEDIRTDVLIIEGIRNYYNIYFF